MSEPSIQLVIQQPALPKYRVPVFRELARRPGIKLALYYGQRGSSPPNVTSFDFENRYVPLYSQQLPGGRPILWHSPQWRYAARARADGQ